MYNINKKSSFSLVELMVVIAIIGILTAVAIPSYSSYVTRGQVSQVIQVLKSLEMAGTMTYLRQGIIPASVTFSGITMTAGQHYPYTSNKYVERVHYNTDGSSMWYCVYASTNVSFPERIDPNSYNGVCSKVSVINGELQTACGSWAVDSGNIPRKYLPSGCNCTNVCPWSGVPNFGCPS